MSEQLTMLIVNLDHDNAAAAKLAAEEAQQASWRSSWNWEGPEIGKPCSIDTCVVEIEDGGFLYAYTERCILIEHRPDGRWLAEIAMGSVRGVPWPKDGTRVLLSVCDIWPPTTDLCALRKAETEPLSPAPPL